MGCDRADGCLLRDLHRLGRNALPGVPRSGFGGHERHDLVLRGEGEPRMTRRRGSAMAAVLCVIAAVLMVLGQTVPALGHVRVLAWIGTLAFLVSAIVVVAKRNPRRRR